MKTCKQCGESREREDFYRAKENKDGRDGTCKFCRRANVKASYDSMTTEERTTFNARKEATRTVKYDHRGYMLKRKYGLSKADYDGLAASQEFVCAICQHECCSGGVLAVDHDHETGEVRGLLCGNCNTGLGKFKDDPALILRAHSYLMDRKDN